MAVTSLMPGICQFHNSKIIGYSIRLWNKA
jgi:hypothetical protein